MVKMQSFKIEKLTTKRQVTTDCEKKWWKDNYEKISKRI